MQLQLPADAQLASAPAVASKAPAAKKSSTTPEGKSAGKPTAKPEAKKAVPASAGVAFYTVRKGDTLHSIAEKKLGGKSHVRDILALNPGLDPRRIGVGTRIKMPAADKAPVVAVAAPSSGSSRPHVR
jgi:nucleoid-associated protein YgaU